MDLLQILANIAQIIGVIWAIAFGGRALFQVVRLRKFPSAGTITNILLSAILLVLISLIIVLRSLAASPPRLDLQPGSTRTPILTTTPNSSPTMTPSFTATASATTNALTASPTSGFAKSGPSNIRLQCTCSDPVLVTITKIDIQPQLNRMLWSITLENVSPNNHDINFRQFYLQQGSSPTSQDTPYYATGGAVDTPVQLQSSGQSGSIQTATLTFLFIPYMGPYTLTSILDPCNGFCGLVSFDPKVIPFT